MRLNIFLAIIFLLSIKCLYSQTAKEYKKNLVLMGSGFELAALSSCQDSAFIAIENAIFEIQRIENLISSWDKKSETAAINRNAGIKPVIVTKELYDLIVRCQKIFNLTDGAFDITFSTLDTLWKFDGTQKSLPDKKDISKLLSVTGFENIILNPEDQSVFLKQKNIKIGFGAIGKGYAANRAKKIMIESGIRSGYVNAGGDITIWGTKENNKKRKVGIADPNKKGNIFSWIEVMDIAVVTSGNYEKYFTFNNKRYSHIINPKTGYPAEGIKSVTIFCVDTELADALATSVFVLGKETGLELINKLEGVECLIIDDENNFIKSNNLKFNLNQNENVDFSVND